MFTYESAIDLQQIFVDFYERGRNACALCHGVATLRYARLANGEPLVAAKTVTGFANVEEDYADNAVWSMNLLPRDKHVMLITGQQNLSGSETARAVIRALGE
jgi:putative intracellular protease/amidase